MDLHILPQICLKSQILHRIINCKNKNLFLLINQSICSAGKYLLMCKQFKKETRKKFLVLVYVVLINLQP